ncbi:hypothetical protein BUY15_08990 [Staphylococcus chromogenes]|uniref:Uncharacterized protein n=1 Tax=Staphylococcus chromogenes TaxID=46126 RepID=A0AAE5SZ36_STACR|nr:hypothetical protein [Staphylococcus chromogenes]PTF39285.1 hypothetical protein BUY17_03785 [Staphylococcus chromogenes]PTF51530.1 hypothetical protein BUY12_06330 [Staphylococcus chromogenes]PTF55304.1 hypothetical protein BUY08_05695 [Staphylococcus chromogenes]PTF60737.1 hypothetical protein BUY07_01100 [Staphylococcus chromogenes]PTF63138.1 hypothetical protein BUY10_04485 [Staphylococcus chromogenes]
MKTVETNFIIEVNEGIYLRINRSEGSCTFTGDPNCASAFLVEEDPTAEKYAEKCGGKIKRFTAIYEVE